MIRSSVIVARRAAATAATATATATATAASRTLCTVVTRRPPRSFVNCLQDEPAPIDYAKALREHREYVDALRANTAVSRVVELDGDEAYPDCSFVEDTAVIVGRVAAMTQPGAPSRRGEVLSMQAELSKLPRMTVVTPRDAVREPEKVRLDGGDVLHVPGVLFVGQSKRTDAHGLAYLHAVFGPHTRSGLQVLGVPVTGALHLKSLLTWGGPGVGFVVGDTPGGRAALQHMRQAFERAHSVGSNHLHYTHHHDHEDHKQQAQQLLRADFDERNVLHLPEQSAANVLRVGNTLYCMGNFTRSRPLFAALQQRLSRQSNSTSSKSSNSSNTSNSSSSSSTTVVMLDHTEMCKADAALTCSSLIIEDA